MVMIIMITLMIMGRRRVRPMMKAMTKILDDQDPKDDEGGDGGVMVLH
jgi:Trk-type K+ transport system membrane component